jgi:hypothetical protein
MNAIDTNNLEVKATKKAKKPAEPQMIEVIPNLVWKIGLFLVVTNLITGGIVWMNKDVLVDHWRDVIHTATAEKQVQAVVEATAAPTATIAPEATKSATVSGIKAEKLAPMQPTKGGCMPGFRLEDDGQCWKLAE